MGGNRTGGSYSASVSTRIRDAAEELQELRRAVNCVWEAGGLDQFLLGHFGAKITIVCPVDPNDRQRDMMVDAGSGLGFKKVAAGCLEKFEHGLVFKRRRISQVNHHLPHRLEPL